MYAFSSRIRYSETDMTEKLSYYGIVNYLQDCCVFHSEDAGAGNDWQRANDTIWMLVSWQIIIEDRPALFETVEIATQPYEFSGLYGKRNHWIRGAGGKEYVKAASVWCLVRPSTGRAVRITDDVRSHYDVAPPAAMDYAGRKIEVPEGGTALAPVTVKRSDLDSNNHMNNSRYIALALDCLPEGFSPSEIRTEYKKQAVMNSRIYPVSAARGDGFVVTLADENGSPYAITEFRK